MIKKSIVLVCCVFLLPSLLKAETSDFDVIYKRMREAYLNNPSKASVESVLGKISSKGSFNDINYKATEGSPRTHLANLAILASAYSNPSNGYFHNTTVLNAYLSGLNFWVDINHQAKNWWFRYIAYPKDLSKSIILMSENIKEDKVLFDKTISYLKWSFEMSKGTGRMWGANGADIIIGSISASILTKNNNEMVVFKDEMTKLVTIQKTEGILTDYMFAQHNGGGRQLYLGNYGKEYMNSILYYYEFCKDTQYNSPGLSTLIDFQINGVQWIFFDKIYDPSITGRFLNSDRNQKTFENLALRLYNAAPNDKKEELKTVYKRINGENSLVGNRMFWLFDYMIHRRTNYMVSTRMTSTRTVGNEAGNGDGELYYYSSNGTNYISTTGEEFAGDFFKKMNNRQFPGTTAEQDSDKLPIAFWGEGGGNEKTFAGGASDGMYGVSGMALQRRGVSANKGWFYFDDEFVCLGSGINEPNGKADVYTTLNQCNLNKKIIYSVDGKEQKMDDSSVTTKLDWLLHNNVGYFNLQPQAQFVITSTNGIFAANVNHGTNPVNQSYAYIVKPETASEKEANDYIKNSPIRVLLNSDTVQAVKNTKLGIIEILFYSAGTLKLDGNNSISVDFPCAIVWNETKNTLTIANPNCESNNPEKIQVKLKKNNVETNLEFQMPTGAYSGSSVTKEVK